MRIIRDLPSPDTCKGTVLALGNFDGVHLGHQAILKHCADFAKVEGKRAAAMTFEPHPREFFTRDHPPLRIYPLREKLKLLESCGIETIFLMRFNQRFASIPAASFIEDVLWRDLKVAHVITGYNFAFGKGRAGNTEMLTDSARLHGFGFTAIAPVEKAGAVISSSAIRQSLSQGSVREASAMLGRPYRITGRVIPGDQRGRELGFPTANIRLGWLYKPRFGVYAARASIDGKGNHEAVVNLGIRPTFSGSEPLLELHCFDLNESLYGKRVTVELTDFIRDEQRFNSVDELKSRIGEDCIRARQLLKGTA